MAAPVWFYCFTIETELIGLAVLNGAPILGTKMTVHRFSTGDVPFGHPTGKHLHMIVQSRTIMGVHGCVIRKKLRLQECAIAGL
jgi:hypothetical protein